MLGPLHGTLAQRTTARDFTASDLVVAQVRDVAGIERTASCDETVAESTMTLVYVPGVVDERW